VVALPTSDPACRTPATRGKPLHHARHHACPGSAGTLPRTWSRTEFRLSYEQELAALAGQLTAKDTSVDKYLAAYETSKINEAVVARRVDQLTSEIRQLRDRCDELTLLLDADSGEPHPDHLAEIPARIREIITTADAPLRRTLCDALIAEAHLTTGSTSATPVFATHQ
jgi:hypothetical protein